MMIGTSLCGVAEVEVMIGTSLCGVEDVEVMIETSLCEVEDVEVMIGIFLCGVEVTLASATSLLNTEVVVVVIGTSCSRLDVGVEL